MVFEKFGKKMGDKAAGLFGFNPDGTRIKDVGKRSREDIETALSVPKRQVEPYSEKKHDSGDLLWGLGFLIVGIICMFFGIMGVGPVLSGSLLIMGVPLLFFGLVGLYFFIIGK